MARKSNKTSHVLNLLTKGTPVSEKENTAKVTIVDESVNDALSENILEKLEAELSESEKKEEKSAAEENAPVVSEQKLPTAADKPAGEAEQEPMAAEGIPAAEAPVSVKQETSMTAAKAAAVEEPIKEKSSGFFNIMEELLERQDIHKYMEQYGVCRCPKCTADIKARTLTNLPAKYVSAEGDFGDPAMNFYENKYKIRILTELIRSCIAVRNNPRHDNN